jgi:CheY-like chemotaxis protein
MPAVGTPTVLVVDDDADTREATMDLLEAAGFRVMTARNGFDALQILWAGLIPTAILVDLNMPTMDGEALCRELDAQPAYAAIPRIMISGRDGASRAAKCKALGFLPKPLDERTLLGLLRDTR